MKRVVMLSIAVGMLSACNDFSLVKGDELNPGAGTVKIVNTEPKGCKFLGEVVGSEGSSFLGGLTSNQELEKGARNILRNKAFALGANIVAVGVNRAGVTGSGSTNSRGRGYSSSTQQTNVIYVGNAYKCQD